MKRLAGLPHFDRRLILPSLIGALLLAMMVVDAVRVLSRSAPEQRQAARVHEVERRLEGLSFTSGWSYMESRGIWGLGDRSEIELVVDEPREAELVVVGRPFPHLDHPQQLTVRLNGVQLAALDILSGDRSYRIAVPRASLCHGTNRLQFGYAVHRRPDGSAQGGASRPLAMHFSRIELVAVADGQLLTRDSRAP